MKVGVEGLRIGLIGFGRLGRTVARSFPQTVVAVLAPEVSPEEIEEVVGVPVPNVPLSTLVHHAEPDVIWIAVPDDQISSVATALGQVTIPDRVRGIFHSSGAHGVELLDGLIYSGVALGGLHPNLILDGRSVFPQGTTWGATGTVEFLDLAAELLAPLDPSIIEVSQEDRPLYHAAATFVANYPILLADIAEHLYREAGLSGRQARGLVVDYLDAVITRLRSADGDVRPLQTMTGPAVRGDTGTLDRHLAEVRERSLPGDAVVLESLIEVARARLKGVGRADGQKGR